MRALQLVDILYEVFVDTLHGPLADSARRLAHTLGLAPAPSIPWSEVFAHEVTLAAPALVADAMPHVPEPVVRDAILAHMLAVIEAFGTDRVEDGQIAPTPELMALLGQARRARDRALARVWPGPSHPSLEFARADRETIRAIETERVIVRSASGTTFGTYEAVSLGKQAVGFPASLALAFAAGWNGARRETLRRALASIWLGLQMHDDVVDWEDDFRRGGAWASALARATGGSPHDARAHVLEARVLERMLSRARRHYRGARLRAAALGAGRLSAWAGTREGAVSQLLTAERTCAGYSVRAHALSAWAQEVLA
jgi:hypothetical protein